MNQLHIFNPDTDYALASDREYYTPPESILKIRREKALLPALYANPGDYILLIDKIDKPIHLLPYYDKVIEKGLKIVSLESAVSEIDLKNCQINPWGWNKNIRKLLIDIFGESINIPSLQQMDTLRRLSHRRTTISFLTSLDVILNKEIEIPKEVSSVEEAMNLYHSDRRLFFKAPWSSSGRGILLTDDLMPKHVKPWLCGIIRRQGSVLVEKAYQKTLDFATEWICNKGESRYLGVSVFEASRRGKYHCNIKAPQHELIEIISKFTSLMNAELLNLQKKAIDYIIAPHYSGPLGIDMLVTVEGNINPCVEINLRHTMGMINLLDEK